MVFPGVKFVPSVVATRMAIVGSSEWRCRWFVAHELLMCWLIGFGAAREGIPASRQDGPERRPEPRVPQFQGLECGVVGGGLCFARRRPPVPAKLADCGLLVAL